MSRCSSLEGKIVAVTGGGSGKVLSRSRDIQSAEAPNAFIGIGLCYTLLAQTHKAKRVIIADICLSERAQEAIDANETIVYLKCDVTKWNNLQALIDFSRDRFGDVPDIFVASAGVLEPVSYDYSAV
jgi:NAD(P)-dependent dehydrogenase (short-subunit alcohol dehydrogenase family)